MRRRFLGNTTHHAPRILIVRPDRIGDVVLSTPVVAALRRQYPTVHITFLVRESVAPIIRGMKGVDAVYVYDPEGRHKGIRGFFRLMEELKAQRFQIAIVLQSTLKIAAALYGVGVPNRLGPLSKIHSFIFYNRGTRQKRSWVEMHEADYNLQLLRRLGIRPSPRHIPTQVHVGDEKKTWAKSWLESKGYEPDPSGHRYLIAVHPGMGGSALNWPENHYIELVRSLDREGHRVLVTGGISEAPLIERIQSVISESAVKPVNPILYYVSEETQTIENLAALFFYCAIVVAPSTGPLHVAVALQKPVVTFYPPIHVQSAIRWGPYVSNPELVGILVPEVFCGQDFKCRGPVCNFYPCMRSIPTKLALEEVHRLLNEVSIQNSLTKDPSDEEKNSEQTTSL